MDSISCDDNNDDKQLTELTPVSLINVKQECTDVKVPYAVDVAIYDDADNNENILYNQLQILYRGLPKEMFVGRILRNEASCVVTLESHRSELFELIKECDDFPYGLQCDLKRRVHTRNGDSVATKLACDIHTLMAVLEGGDFCEPKDLIGSGKGQRSQSQSQSGVCNMTLNPCDCASEIKALTENMNNLKASLLNVQQTQLATETTRSSQIQNLKFTVLGLKMTLLCFPLQFPKLLLTFVSLVNALNLRKALVSLA